jgi:hypothetical protein
MIRKFILPAALLLVVAACNNSSDADKKTTDTSAATGHDMNHTAPTGGVPELPAVPEGAKVSFKNLKDGATVSSTFKVEMGAEGIKVDTAGPVLAGVGHHHILIDSLHKHFGKAQTQTELTLTPGKHRLTLQFADGLHRSYGAKMATSVTVTVKQ